MTRAPERVGGRPVAGRRSRRASDPDLLSGRYRLHAPIGEGATSTVWLAHDERLDRPVAVKILRPGPLADGGACRRLRDEARSIARLSHPNVVGVHDVLVGHGRAALVLEHVPGRSLGDRLRDGPMPPAEALRIGAEVAGGLGAAHRLGIVHRDVKPANILLGDDGRARLADFGIATALGATSAAEAGGVAGSLRYLAPERLRGDPPSRAADVWSLGVVTYRMLAGRMPFAGRSAAELHDAAMAGRPRPLGGSVVPPAAAAAISRALDPDPGRRPSATAFGAALAAGPVGEARSAAPVATLTGLVASAAARLRGADDRRGVAPDEVPTLTAITPIGPLVPAESAAGRPGASPRRAHAALGAAGAVLLVAAVLAAALAPPPAPVTPGDAGAIPSAGAGSAASPSAATPAPTAPPTAAPSLVATTVARPHGKGHGHGGGGGEGGDSQGG